MITVPTRAETPENPATSLAAQRLLIHAARELMIQVGTRCPQRLGQCGLRPLVFRTLSLR